MKSTVWEYMSASATIQSLNDLGARGWEAVGAVNESGQVLLKRPAPDFREVVTLDQRRSVFHSRGLDLPEDEI